MGLPGVTGQGIEHRHRVAGKIHEQLFARRVRLAHRRRHAPAPVAVEAAKPTVAKPIRLVGAVLQPEQHQRHATALELFMQARPTSGGRFGFSSNEGAVNSRRSSSAASISSGTGQVMPIT